MSLVRAAKVLLAGSALGTLALLGEAPPASAVNFDFSSDVSASVAFTGTGDTFTFADGLFGKDFVITLETGGVALLGLKGNITGTFTVGAITINGSQESAPVTGPGTFQITDGASIVFTADLAW